MEKAKTYKKANKERIIKFQITKFKEKINIKIINLNLMIHFNQKVSTPQ